PRADSYAACSKINKLVSEKAKRRGRSPFRLVTLSKRLTGYVARMADMYGTAPGRAVHPLGWGGHTAYLLVRRAGSGRHRGRRVVREQAPQQRERRPGDRVGCPAVAADPGADRRAAVVRGAGHARGHRRVLALRPALDYQPAPGRHEHL